MICFFIFPIFAKWGGSNEYPHFYVLELKEEK